MHVWALGLSCETPASGPPGLHATTRELQTRTLKGPGASNTTKIPRADTQRDTKRAKKVAGEGKKSAKFWAHPSEGACSSMFFRCFEKQENTETVKLAKVGLAKVGLAKVGQIRMAKVGLAKVGLSPIPTLVNAHRTDSWSSVTSSNFMGSSPSNDLQRLRRKFNSSRDQRSTFLSED